MQQPPSTHLLDFNRVSHPLIEVISLPQIHDPVTAAVFVRKVQTILKTVNSVTAGMEMGGLRADVNVSVKQRNGDVTHSIHSYHGVGQLGQRTEIKNLASLKAIEDAIIAERDRQIDLLENGGVVEGETRGWTLGSKSTKRLRGKEGEIDYRYMPDPDIAPVLIGQVNRPSHGYWLVLTSTGSHYPFAADTARPLRRNSEHTSRQRHVWIDDQRRKYSDCPRRW